MKPFGYMTRDFTVETLRRAELRQRSPEIIRTHRVARPSSEKRNTWYIAKTGPCMIEGCINSGAIDSYGQILDPSGMECGDLPIPLRYKHSEDPADQIGEVVYLRRVESAVVWARAIVTHEGVWQRILDGRLQCFSVGTVDLSDPEPHASGAGLIRSWRLKEVSIVPHGANPEAVFWPWDPPGRKPVRLLT